MAHFLRLYLFPEVHVYAKLHLGLISYDYIYSLKSMFMPNYTYGSFHTTISIPWSPCLCQTTLRAHFLRLYLFPEVHVHAKLHLGLISYDYIYSLKSMFLPNYTYGSFLTTISIPWSPCLRQTTLMVHFIRLYLFPEVHVYAKLHLWFISYDYIYSLKSMFMPNYTYGSFLTTISIPWSPCLRQTTLMVHFLRLYLFPEVHVYAKLHLWFISYDYIYSLKSMFMPNYT